MGDQLLYWIERIIFVLILVIVLAVAVGIYGLSAQQVGKTGHVSPIVQTVQAKR